MRKILLILLLPLALASPLFQTLGDIGIDARVIAPEKNGEWIIPYEFPENCTPFAIFYLKAGKMVVYNNGEEILVATEPGTYRTLIERNGTVKIMLERQEGEMSAEIERNSFIACKDTPFLEVNATVPAMFDVGGYTDVKIKINNRGTGEADTNIVLRLPKELAPVKPVNSVKIKALSEKNVAITITAAEEFGPRLFYPICIKYRDSYGEWEACTREYITEGKMRVPTACFIHNDEISILNYGTKPIQINGNEILPKDMQTYGLQDANWQDICDFTIKIEKGVLEPIEDYSWLSALFLALSGVLGVVASEKRIKTRNA